LKGEKLPFIVALKGHAQILNLLSGKRFRRIRAYMMKKCGCTLDWRTRIWRSLVFFDNMEKTKNPANPICRAFGAFWLEL